MLSYVGQDPVNQFDSNGLSTYYLTALGYEDAPYLKGGVTIAGIDCSGLVCAAVGLTEHDWVTYEGPPPGNWEKIMSANKAMSFSGMSTNLREGDLLVWPQGRHAVFYAGDGRIFHAHGAKGTPTGFTGDFKGFYYPTFGAPDVYRQPKDSNKITPCD